jgi:biotin carboxylase
LPRIWFNRTYGTNSHIIAMLRDNPQHRPVHVVATHSDPDSPVLAASDEAYPEPDLPVPDYVSWALDFARDHRIDVLVPRLHMAALADARADFERRGTRLLCPAGDTVRLFEDKPAAYRAATALGLPVPPHHVVTDAAGLREAHKQLAEVSDVVCVKPTHGVGGSGFRILSTEPPSLADFTGQVRPKAHVDAFCRALDEAEADGARMPELLVMPFLTGPEISVDVLADADGRVFAAVGRGRSRRRRLIVDDRGAREVAAALTRAQAVAYLSNTQVRYWEGPDDTAPRPYLLEVNTRISGGLFQTSLAGVNLAWDAVRLALGETVDPIAPRYGRAFTSLSSLVPLP